MRDLSPWLFAVLVALCPSAAGASHAQVVVNEVMASNAATIADPDFGSSADWIELHNPSPEAVDLGGAFLTDDLEAPARWAFPAGATLAPGGYLLVWASGEDTGPPEATGYHTSFKLSAGGEAVGLFSASGAVLDTVTFGESHVDRVAPGRWESRKPARQS